MSAGVGTYSESRKPGPSTNRSSVGSDRSTDSTGEEGAGADGGDKAEEGG